MAHGDRAAQSVSQSHKMLFSVHTYTRKVKAISHARTYMKFSVIGCQVVKTPCASVFATFLEGDKGDKRVTRKMFTAAHPLEGRCGGTNFHNMRGCWRNMPGY